MRLLLVEDDAMIGEALRTGLRRDGFAVDWVRDGDSADQVLRTEPFDLLLLDLGLPRKDGLQLLKSLRSRNEMLPVLIITARDAVSDRVQGLDAGADDYLVKPFDLDELAARIRTVLRRMPTADASEGAFSHGPLRLFPKRHAATWNGTCVALTHREFWVLETLVRRRNQVLSRAMLEEALYAWGEEVDSNAIEVYVHYLRRKLGSELIQTVRGVGYQLAPLTAYA
jgi:two-component system response regulator QseB